MTIVTLKIGATHRWISVLAIDQWCLEPFCKQRKRVATTWRFYLFRADPRRNTGGIHGRHRSPNCCPNSPVLGCCGASRRLPPVRSYSPGRCAPICVTGCLDLRRSLGQRTAQHVGANPLVHRQLLRHCPLPILKFKVLVRGAPQKEVGDHSCWFQATMEQKESLFSYACPLPEFIGTRYHQMYSSPPPPVVNRGTDTCPTLTSPPENVSPQWFGHVDTSLLELKAGNTKAQSSSIFGRKPSVLV